jgi:hypothetical protein
MASTAVPARTRPARPPWHKRARNALTAAVTQGTTMASAARHRYRRPALVISAFGCIDTAAWTSYGPGAGLLVLGALILVIEVLGGEE